ncbi:hypothetical protein F5Y15DRAFT_416233 [Xylariaceae sp. FL0016]|nr:hypothetical protein F5Y15DRAFT_416233 [Xylariaceae sp. FL0016]
MRVPIIVLVTLMGLVVATSFEPRRNSLGWNSDGGQAGMGPGDPSRDGNDGVWDDSNDSDDNEDGYDGPGGEGDGHDGPPAGDHTITQPIPSITTTTAVSVSTTSLAETATGGELDTVTSPSPSTPTETGLGTVNPDSPTVSLTYNTISGTLLITTSATDCKVCTTTTTAPASATATTVTTNITPTTSAIPQLQTGAAMALRRGSGPLFAVVMALALVRE